MKALQPLLYSLLLPLVAATLSCARRPAPPRNPGLWERVLITTDDPGGHFSVPVLVYTPAVQSIPDGGYPLMIVLHGWNQNMEDWRDQSGISRWADRFGVLVVAPRMGKANYEFRYYPETRMKWQPKPSGRWIGEDLYPYIKNHYPITPSRMKHGVMGVSTGGHGAALLAGYFPRIFGYAASISGDFNLPEMPEDRLSINTFGPYNLHPDRWRDGSSFHMLQQMKGSHLYIAHGTKDRTSPVSQSREMAAALRKSGIASKYRENSDAGHNWEYWKTEVGPAMEYFIKN